ncbi:radical SAM protein [bacterium]|nr:radical SAM protein [candidate division CSSED10-310 bacterium]
MTSNHHSSVTQRAWNIGRRQFGNNIICYFPGMFYFYGKRGKYPAVSITGNQCDLQCDHCKGRLLESMIPAVTPEHLYALCKRLEDNGHLGILISGGCDESGCIPWQPFIPVIRQIKEETNLFISMHCGFSNDKDIDRLASSKVDQILIDVVGSDETIENIYHLENGLDHLKRTLSKLKLSGIPIIPHILLGLNYGVINSEWSALEMVQDINPGLLVVIVIMSLQQTPMSAVKPPTLDDIIDFFSACRVRLPLTEIALGCARSRHRLDIEKAAIDCGFNRIAIPSAEVCEYARKQHLQVLFQNTCCSVPYMESFNENGKS